MIGCRCTGSAVRRRFPALYLFPCILNSFLSHSRELPGRGSSRTSSRCGIFPADKRKIGGIIGCMMCQASLSIRFLYHKRMPDAGDLAVRIRRMRKTHIRVFHSFYLNTAICLLLYILHFQLIVIRKKPQIQSGCLADSVLQLRLPHPCFPYPDFLPPIRQTHRT